MDANYRQTINESAMLKAALRDQQIELIGVRAKVRYRLGDGTDLYGDPSGANLVEDYIYCIPAYEADYKMLNRAGIIDELDLPLEVRIKTTDYLPQNTELTLPPFQLPTGDYADERRWHVKVVQLKKVERTYEMVAKCVPVREFIEDEEQEESIVYGEEVVETGASGDDDDELLVDYGIPE